jgi:hypothetical protein
MKKSVKVLACIAALITLAGGCISYEYTGSSEAPVSGEAKIFASRNDLKRQYKVLGRAVVAANYQDVSRDRMIGKLRDEARDCGADAILIVEQQVLPAGMVSGSRGQGFFTAFDYDDSSRSRGELQRDVDVTIGNIGQSAAPGTDAGSSGYKRIIRAEFLRFTGTAAPSAGK